MSAASLAAFAGLCALLAVAPGPDTFLALRCALGGARAGVAAALGSGIGSLLWALAVACGVAVLLEESATAYRVVKVVGGLYLLWLGASALLRSRRSAGVAGAGEPVRPSGLGAGAALRAGVLSTATNPKVGLFFLAVVPQFLPADGAAFATTMLLGAVDAVVGTAWLSLLAVLAARAVAWLRRPRVARALDRLSAAVLAAFGAGTLASAR